MEAFLIAIAIIAASFFAGYQVRAAVSSRRRRHRSF
jgi:hypothetical protein